MLGRAAVLAALLFMAPCGANAADLVVWWDEGYSPEENAAVRETVAAFEHDTGKQVELVFHPMEELPDQIGAALEAGQPPDFAFGFWLEGEQWAYEDRLVDLTDAIGHFSNLFDAGQLQHAVLLNGTTGEKALYGLPVGQITHLSHVWTSLLEQAGYTLEDIPREWDAYWSFWCDQVQPALRQATGRDDIWAVGLPMSIEAADTGNAFGQFQIAYEADYVTPDGRLIIDEPEIRQRLIKAMDSYTTIQLKGCSPPDSVTWPDSGNNKAFLAQSVVMTPNLSLSIPNALKNDRPDDYYENTATIEWPLSPSGEPFPIVAVVHFAMAFSDGAHVAIAKEFVRFLVEEGWLIHYLDFSGERMLPSIAKLLDQPFWLDPSDPHKMAAVMQAASRPLAHDYAVASGDRRHDQVATERVWATAVHRVVTEGITPEQAVDEAIARTKEILSE